MSIYHDLALSVSPSLIYVGLLFWTCVGMSPKFVSLSWTRDEMSEAIWDVFLLSLTAYLWTLINTNVCILFVLYSSHGNVCWCAMALCECWWIGCEWRWTDVGTVIPDGDFFSLAGAGTGKKASPWPLAGMETRIEDFFLPAGTGMGRHCSTGNSPLPSLLVMFASYTCDVLIVYIWSSTMFFLMFT